MMYKRILIIGPSGAGKTTLSEYIGNKTGLNVIHLDKQYWLPNWKAPVHEEFKQKVIDFASKDSWIIEGNYYQTLDERLKRADLVIYLKTNKIKCVLSILKRVRLTRTHILNRHDLANGCTEDKVDMNLVKWSYNYEKQYAPIIDGIIAKYPNVKVITFNKRRVAYKYVDKEMLKND